MTTANSQGKPNDRYCNGPDMIDRIRAGEKILTECCKEPIVEVTEDRRLRYRCGGCRNEFLFT